MTAATSTTCPVCTYAEDHGSWPPEHRGTHCRVCHRSWASRREAHCPVCCGHFTSDSTAERHWRRNHHLDPATVPDLHLGSDAVWSTTPDRDPDALKARMSGARRAKAAAR